MELEQITGDVTPLSESITMDESGTMDIKIISPGWGSSGYYSSDFLRKYAEKYTEGIQNFIDHPTPIQERERPERSLRDLASVQISPARYEESGFKGPGVYAKVKVFPEFREMIKSRAPYIGMSHRAEGTTKIGEAEGRKGKIIESISRVHSVDYVTRPGAGGALGTLIESEKLDITGMADPETKTVLLESWNEMREAQKLTESKNQELMQETKTLKEQVAAKDVEISTLKESLAKSQELTILSEAASYAIELLAATHLPALAQNRLKESLTRQATAKDGKLDRDAFKTLAESAIKAEAEYISSIGGNGRVTGMGGSSSTGPTLEEAQKNLINQFMSTGMSESQAKAAAGVRV